MAQLSKQDRQWFYAAAIGFGLCLSSLECERYTAFWSFGSRSAVELAVIVALTAAVLAFISAMNVRTGGSIYRCLPLVVAVALIQTIGVCGRVAGLSAFPIPGIFDASFRVAMQSAGLLFVLYGSFFFEVGIRKFIMAFAVASFVAGFIQIAVIAIPLYAAYVCLILLAPCSAMLLIVAGSRYQGNLRKAAIEDVDVEAVRMASLEGETHPLSFCVIIFLLLVLIMALSHQGILLQDGARRSWLLQVVSGSSAIAASLFLAVALNVFKEVELIELMRSMLLPMVLVSLYLSTLLGAAGLPVYMAILEVCYLAVFVLVMTVPRTSDAPNRFSFFCKAYFASRLGWAFGFLGFILLSPQWGNMLIAFLVLLSFGVLLALFGYREIQNARRTAMAARSSVEKGKDSGSRALGEESIREDDTSESLLDSALRAACEQVAKQYQLTPRESEVLPYLARGRNARYVANALVISDGTARTHIMHIYQKLEVNSQQSLMDIIERAASDISGYMAK